MHIWGWEEQEEEVGCSLQELRKYEHPERED
jgi:hypothetical protein